jgi:MFS family permease
MLHDADTRRLAMAITAIGVCNIAVGILVPLLPLLMEARGSSAGTIGAVSAAGQVGAFLAGFSVPRIVQRLPGKSIVLSAMALLALALAAFALTDHLVAWMVLRFATGVAIASAFTVSESWILGGASDGARARVTSVYTSVLTVSFGLGPLLLSFSGGANGAAGSGLPWLIAAALSAIGLLIVAVTIPRQPAAGGGSQGSRTFRVLRQAPLAFLGIATPALFEWMMLPFFAIFAVRNGVPLATATQTLAIAIIGCLLFYFPTGQLADRWSRNGMVLLLSAAVLVFAPLLLVSINTPFAWLVTLLLRASAFGVFLVSFTVLGDRFKGDDLVAATSINAMTWGLTGMIGPPAAGLMIDSFGINALPWLLMVPYVGLLVALGFNGWRITGVERTVSGTPGA